MLCDALLQVFAGHAASSYLREHTTLQETLWPLCDRKEVRPPGMQEASGINELLPAILQRLTGITPIFAGLQASRRGTGSLISKHQILDLNNLQLSKV